MKATLPRMVEFDIETAPSLGWFFDPHAENNILETEQEWFMLSYAYKWLDEEKIHVRALCDYRGYKKNKTDDEKLVTDLHKLLSSADYVIGHNGDNFDIKRANARMVYHSLTPPEPYKTIDTLKIWRKYFKGNSGKLDAIARYFGVGRKLPHSGKDTWLGCVRGDPKSWRLMKEYNKHDVYLLHKVYLKLRPWATNHPNINIESRQLHACPTCGSTHIIRQGFKYTRTGEKQQYQCMNCFRWWTEKSPKAQAL